MHVLIINEAGYIYLQCMTRKTKHDLAVLELYSFSLKYINFRLKLRKIKHSKIIFKSKL